MHIRHTERPATTPATIDRLRRTGEQALSTERGKQAAFEFGHALPPTRVYRLYHTPNPRTIETAHQIRDGLQARGGAPQLKGVFIKHDIDQEKLIYYIGRDGFTGGRLNARQLILNLLSGRYPPWELEPGFLFAQRHAAIMVDNLRTASADGLDLYVSHDVLVLFFLFYWFAILPDDHITYLDGFLLQLTDDGMQVYTKDGATTVRYPYWWRF